MTFPDIGTVLCAGRAYCDLLFTGLPEWPTPGHEIFGSGLSIDAGGGAINTAAALVSLGKSASVFTVLPAAPFDTTVRERLSAHGICTASSHPAPAGADPQITVALPSKDDRAFITRKSGAALPDLSKLPKSGIHHLHIGELATLVEHPDLVHAAQSRGWSTSLDCGWDADLLMQGDQLSDLIGAVDVFLPNEIEWAALTASGLHETTPALTIVKTGKTGSRCFSDGSWKSVGGYPATVVNATGAGDAFNGGFLATWLEGGSLETCLAQGNLCGAAAVSQVGGMLSQDTLDRHACLAATP